MFSFPLLYISARPNSVNQFLSDITHCIQIRILLQVESLETLKNAQHDLKFSLQPCEAAAGENENGSKSY